MSRLIDADALMEYADCELKNQKIDLSEFRTLVYHLNMGVSPTVDAVPVVRCGECKHWHEVDSVDGTRFGECKRPHPIIRKSVFLQEGWYCADGERKDDDNV